MTPIHIDDTIVLFFIPPLTLRDQRALTMLLRQGKSNGPAGLADWERETATDTGKGAVSLHY